MSETPPGGEPEDAKSTAETEKRLYAEWEAQGCFKAGRAPGAPYTIVIPPPNVTGNLHMGHALNNTLQDVLCRFERMRGRDVLWQPGTDHAGIATQMVVERRLAEAGEPSRREMGRDAFLERVWQWKEESGSTITEQLRRLGASCDWSRERFTMDEGLSKAVLKVFAALYNEGLIYKDKRLVNWDPKLLTAISDLEVVQKEVQSHLWHFNYPLEDGSGHITVATTRPETMLGDTGVAVHPDDERHRGLVGRHVILPIVGRRIPIVADSHADPEQGSGAVKITPAHDFNDFEVGRRCGLRPVNIMDKSARIELGEEDFGGMENREAWQGLDRFEARKKVVEAITALGLLDKIEDNTHMVPFGDRSDVAIEPWLTDQWYVDAKTLAGPAIEAVKSGRTKFVPANWDKTYFEWMDNIQPWCVSRQLWWGHRIPAWYGPDGEIFVAENEDEAQAAAQSHYGRETPLRRDEDVLDTWFSSALWPFSTLGWPDDTPELKRHYQTDVLVTGFDIIFFWVARMMMMGLHFKQEAPFHTVYIHALVRDEKGAKMSKSRGNVIDPLELIDAYGADALRFTLSAMAAMGRDIKLAESRVAGYRNFSTKLRNATRFCDMNGCLSAGAFNPAEAGLPLTQWLVGETWRAQRAVTAALEAYRFNDAANAVYQFIWDGFCDWFIELAKPVLQGGDGPEKQEVRAAAKWGLINALKLLHPFMPFVTEELWQDMGQGGFLMLAGWPELDEKDLNEEADEEIAWLIAAIREIRSVRTEMNVPAGAKIPLVVSGGNEDTQRRLGAHGDVLKRLARLDDIQLQEGFPDGSVQSIVNEAVFALPLAGVIDVEAESERLAKEAEKVKKEISRLSGKLNNAGFLEKAPDHVVEENKSRLDEEQGKLEKLQSALDRLS